MARIQQPAFTATLVPSHARTSAPESDAPEPAPNGSPANGEAHQNKGPGLETVFEGEGTAGQPVPRGFPAGGAPVVQSANRAPPAAGGYARPTSNGVPQNGTDRGRRPVALSQDNLAHPGIPPTPHVTPAKANVRQRPPPLAKHAKSRIDPEQIPRPKECYNNPKDVGGKVYETCAYTVPPAAASLYTISDTGSASCRFMRATMNSVPVYHSSAITSHVPIAVHCTPFADVAEREKAVPVVDTGELGPFRCNRCKGYVNPGFSWAAGGREGVCNFCGSHAVVPNDYLCGLEANGQRRDRRDRPELVKGSVDFTAPASYSDKPEVVPAYIFVIDATAPAVASGLLAQITASLRALVEHMPQHVPVGVITFGSVVQFYRLDTPDAQMLVMSDVEDPFLPCGRKALLRPLEQVVDVLDQLLERIPAWFVETRGLESAGVAAMAAAVELATSHGAGQIFCCFGTLPSIGVGALKQRDDIAVYGKPAEQDLYQCQHKALFEGLVKQCLEGSVAVDVFLAPSANSYIDVTTMGYVPQRTGGDVFYYNSFAAAEDGEKLHYDLARAVTRNVAFGCVFKLRVSRGLTPVQLVAPWPPDGGFDHSMCMVPRFSCDTTIGIVFVHDDQVGSAKNLYIQTACLYMNIFGKRFIRVQTLVLPTSTSVASLFRGSCSDAVISLMLKQAALNRLSAAWDPKKMERQLSEETVNILHAYRVNCATSTAAAQLILPEALKQLPLLILSIFKLPGFKVSSDVRVDERMAALLRYLTLPVARVPPLLYPRIVGLHNLTEVAGQATGVGQYVNLPPTVPCSADKMTPDGAYFVENGEVLWLYLGFDVPSSFLQEAFGICSLDGILPENLRLDPQRSPLTATLCAMANQIRTVKGSHPWMPLKIACPNTKEEFKVISLLVEDPLAGQPSYVDHLCGLHKRIQHKLDSY